MAADPAGDPVRRLLGDPAADDGGELFGAGHHQPRAARLRRHRVVQVGDARRRLAGRADPADGLFAVGAAGRNPARHRPGLGDAGQGLALVGRAGAGRHLALDPVERRRHDLANLWPHRYRPARRLAESAGLRVQLHRQRHPRLAHRAADGRVALDAAGGAAVLRRPARDPRCLLPSGEHRRREQVRRLPLHPVAQAARRADDRRAAALHGQLHDLHRALRAHRRWARQCHDLLEPVPDAKRPSDSSISGPRRPSR